MNNCAQSVTVSVPGKVMLAGEYCILEGGSALAATISQSLRVRINRLAPNTGCLVRSDMWDDVIDLNEAGSAKPKDVQIPLLEAASWCISTFELSDIEIVVDSDLDVKHGVGSSAALRYGLLLAASSMKNGVPDAGARWDLARHAWALQTQGQFGISSGYDIATQNLGGLVCMSPADDFESWPGIVTRMSQGPAWLNRYLHIYVSGNGAPTASLVRTMQIWLDQDQRRPILKQKSEQLVSHLSELVATSQEPDAELFQNIKSLRDFFDCSPAALPWKHKLKAIQGLDIDWSYKTTGAGGDDAIIVFASPEFNNNFIAPVLARIGVSLAPFCFSNQRAEVSLQ